MPMNTWLWALILFLQNAAFTWVSRARNSGSYSYHAIAATASNGLFFVAHFMMIGFAAKPDLTTTAAIQLGAIYISATVSGSVAMLDQLAIKHCASQTGDQKMTIVQPLLLIVNGALYQCLPAQPIEQIWQVQCKTIKPAITPLKPSKQPKTQLSI
jgi:Na+-driven multidrug efflux pump